MNDDHVKPKEQGQSLVELAMSLVILLTILAGLVDFGRAFFTYIALRDAAQEGASYAAVVNADALNSSDVATYCTEITDRVLMTTKDLNGGVSNDPINLELLASEGNVAVKTKINNADCSSAAAADICMGGAVTVKVTYDNFPLTMPFMGTIIGSQTIPLSAEVIDSILTPACQ